MFFDGHVTHWSSVLESYPYTSSLHWLLVSSRVAGMADFHHLTSPPPFSISSPARKHGLFMLACVFLVFGRPLFFFPVKFVLRTLLAMRSSSLHITSPYQFGILSTRSRSEASATLVVHRMLYILVLSLRVTWHPHLV